AVFAAISGGAAEPLWLGLPAWRWMFMAEAVPAIIYGVISLRLPESPRYLVLHDDEEKAARVLHDYTGEIDVQGRIGQIKQSLRSAEKESLRDILGNSFGLKPIVWVGILLSVFQQFVGINVIFYYSTTLWQSVGFDESSAMTTSVISSVTNIVVTIVAILLVDRVGRRRMLLTGSVVMAISLGLMALSFSFATTTDAGVSLPQPWSFIALLFANLFIVGFGATWGPLVWVLLGEMFPNRIRASALAVAAAAQWLANFAVSTTFPWLSDIGLSF